MDCIADLLLVSVWDRTATGTARSKTENRQLSSAMLLLAVPEAFSSHTKTRSRSSVQYIFCVAPCCPRGSLVPYKNEEQISCAVHSLCCSSLSQMQSCPIQKQGASLLQGSPCREKSACGMGRTHKISFHNTDCSVAAPAALSMVPL